MSRTACAMHGNPAICRCVRLFLYDPTLPPDERDADVEAVESYTSPVDGVTYYTVRCPAHLIPDVAEHMRVIVEEGQRTTSVLVAIKRDFAKLTRKNDQGDDDFDPALVTWTFDEKRHLVVDAPSLTPDEKAQLDAATPASVSVR